MQHLFGIGDRLWFLSGRCNGELPHGFNGGLPMLVSTGLGNARTPWGAASGLVTRALAPLGRVLAAGQRHTYRNDDMSIEYRKDARLAC